MRVTETALAVMKERVLHEGESPADMVERVVRTVAETAEQERRFRDVMTNLHFLPNSPCLVNAGTKLGQLAACFVLPVHDNIESIFQTLKDAAVIQKTGGGVGFNFSQLRPRDAHVFSTGGVASGPVSFMAIYNEATEQVKQGGRRRGASLSVLNVDHPDIREFILPQIQEVE